VKQISIKKFRCTTRTLETLVLEISLRWEENNSIRRTVEGQWSSFFRATVTTGVMILCQLSPLHDPPLSQQFFCHHHVIAVALSPQSTVSYHCHSFTVITAVATVTTIHRHHCHHDPQSLLHCHHDPRSTLTTVTTVLLSSPPLSPATVALSLLSTHCYNRKSRAYLQSNFVHNRSESFWRNSSFGNLLEDHHNVSAADYKLKRGRNKTHNE
jgi:hypothetical protein